MVLNLAWISAMYRRANTGAEPGLDKCHVQAFEHVAIGIETHNADNTTSAKPFGIFVKSRLHVRKVLRRAIESIYFSQKLCRSRVTKSCGPS